MSTGENDRPAGTSPRKIALMGAIATALAVFNLMSDGSEAPSRTLLVLDYVFLAAGLVSLGGGLLMMARSPGR